MKVRCFGIAREIIGSDELIVDPNAAQSVEELRKLIIQTYPEFEKYSSFMISVDFEYAKDSFQLTGKEEIAIIPPVSGG